MLDAAILKGNEEVTRRLEALVARLSVSNLAVDLGDGWNVAIALAHLAFWDYRIAYVLGRWTKGGAPHEELDDDVVNNALEEVLRAVEPGAAGRLAVEAARRANDAIAAAPDAIVGQILSADHTYLLDRSNHRNEHIEQIERALPK